MDSKENSPPLGGDRAEGGEEQPRSSRNLEEYAHVLEMKLTVKSGLLDEAIHLQQELSGRLAVLDHGLSWKDAQLQEVSHQNNEAYRSAATWQQRSEQLEEENCVLRDALLEHADQIDQLQRMMTMEFQAHQHQLAKAAAHAALSAQQQISAHGGSAAQEQVIKHLKEQLKKSNQKTVLLEEQLRIRSGADTLGHDDATEFGGGLLELALLPPAEVWASIGRGAADRICGVTPHSAMDFMPRNRHTSIGSCLSDFSDGDSYWEPSPMARRASNSSISPSAVAMSSVPEQPSDILTNPVSPPVTTGWAAPLPRLVSNGVPGIACVRLPPSQDDPASPSNVARQLHTAALPESPCVNMRSTDVFPSDGLDRQDSWAESARPVPELSPLPIHSRQAVGNIDLGFSPSSASSPQQGSWQPQQQQQQLLQQQLAQQQMQYLQSQGHRAAQTAQSAVATAGQVQQNMLQVPQGMSACTASPSQSWPFSSRAPIYRSSPLPTGPLPTATASATGSLPLSTAARPGSVGARNV